MKKHLFTTLTLALCAAAPTAYAQTAAERAAISSTYDQVLLRSMADEWARKAAIDKQIAIEYARKHGLPLIRETAEGGWEELIRIDEGNVPITTLQTTLMQRNPRGPITCIPAAGWV